jgi:hypothetical protein
MWLSIIAWEKEIRKLINGCRTTWMNSAVTLTEEILAK